MKALFAHDHRFVVDNGETWSNQFDTVVWKRYLEHFEHLTVAARKSHLIRAALADRLKRSSGPRVSFKLFGNLSGLGGLTIARPAARRRMRALVETHDAVIARLPSEIGLLAIAAAKAKGKPWAVEVVDCPWDGLRHYGTWTGTAYAPIARWRMASCVSQAGHVIYVTEAFLQRRYPTAAANIASASNVILSDLCEPVLATRLHRIGSDQEPPTRCGMIASLNGRFKGIQTVLAVLAKIRNEAPPLSLHILGGGDPAPWQDEAARLGVADLVHFEGTLPAGQPVFEWLDKIDIYLQPSLKEGLPRALIEAMSRGCPAIASTVAGIPELLPADDLIKPGDTDALARLLQQRAGDRSWMADRAQRNWQEAGNYRADVLDARRDAFWAKFAAEARHHGRFAGKPCRQVSRCR